MTKTIKYIGPQDPWPELAITGKQSMWHSGQIEKRLNHEAEFLLAQNTFALISADPETPATITTAFQRIFSLPEGQTLKLTPAASTTGTAQLLNQALPGINVTVTTPVSSSVVTMGPYTCAQKILVTCAAGSIGVTAANSPASPNAQGDLVSDGSTIPVSGNYPDFFIDAFISGMVLPTSGGLTNTITAGVAYISGRRRAFAGSAVTLTASSDNYVDARLDGTYLVTAVAIGAAAPAVAVDSLRAGFITTGSSTITSATITGKDSLGNWMGNRVRSRTCILGDANTQSFAAGVDTYVPFASASLEVMDNAFMHSASTNPSRITIQVSGLYQISGFVAWATGNGAFSLVIAKNRAGRIPGTSVDLTGSSNKLSAAVSGPPAYLNAGDYIELRGNSVGAMSITLAGLSATRIG